MVFASLVSGSLYDDWYGRGPGLTDINDAAESASQAAARAAGRYPEALLGFAQEMERLYVSAGAPSLSDLVESSRSSGRGAVSIGGLSDVLRGRRFPSLDYTITMIRLLTKGQVQAGVLDQWRARWQSVKLLQRAARGTRGQARTAGPAAGETGSAGPHQVPLAPPAAGAAEVHSAGTSAPRQGEPAFREFGNRDSAVRHKGRMRNPGEGRRGSFAGGGPRGNAFRVGPRQPGPRLARHGVLPAHRPAPADGEPRRLPGAFRLSLLQP